MKQTSILVCTLWLATQYKILYNSKGFICAYSGPHLMMTFFMVEFREQGAPYDERKHSNLLPLIFPLLSPFSLFSLSLFLLCFCLCPCILLILSLFTEGFNYGTELYLDNLMGLFFFFLLLRCPSSEYPT